MLDIKIPKGKKANFRGWAFTSYKPDKDWQALFDSDVNILYLLLGEELCPTTGRMHWQGFIYFKNYRESKKKMMNLLEVAIDGCNPIYSSPACNIRYCKKEGKFIEYGKEPKQGKRNDLIELKQKIADGMSVDDLAMENPMAVHQYGRTLNLIADIALRKKWRNFMTEGYWLFGATGTGKSHFWKKTYNPETHYIVEVSDKGWWDGYSGQEVVIFDEFRGGTPYSELLSLVNDTPKRVPRRGREPVPFLAKKVIITSSLNPRKCYYNLDKSDSWDQFYRRFQVIKFKDRNSIQVNLYNATNVVKAKELQINDFDDFEVTESQKEFA